MKNPNTIGETTRFYRRGTIMGLTVAETFILLVFALLLLMLLIWDELAEKDDTNQELVSQLSQWEPLFTAPHLKSSLIVLKDLSPEQGNLLGEFLTKDELTERLAKVNEFEEFLTDPDAESLVRQLVEMDPDLRKQLGEWMNSPRFAVVVQGQSHIDDVIEAGYEVADLSALSQLVDEQDLEQWETVLADPDLASSFDRLRKMSSEERRRLSEFMIRDKLMERLAKVNEFEEFLTDPDAESLARQLIEMDPDLRKQLDEWMNSPRFADAVHRRDEVSILMNSNHNLIRVIEQLDRKSLVSTEVKQNIDKKMGEIVRQFGGEIGPDGVISVPSDRSFAAGEATLTTEFKFFLTNFCPKYIQGLHQYQSSIRDIRVEGHASSEWLASSSVKERFLNNLDLSQRRAYAVLSYCLELLENPTIFQWATKKITAVGFSSARPILNEDNTEDKERSRRVAFSYIETQSTPNSGFQSTVD